MLIGLTAVVPLASVYVPKMDAPLARVILPVVVRSPVNVVALIVIVDPARANVDPAVASIVKL